jgi:hypothetical protein
MFVPPPLARADRTGTRALTAHVAEEIHQAIKEFAGREHLTVDEALHLSLAILLRDNGQKLPEALSLKLRQRRLMSYLTPTPVSAGTLLDTATNGVDLVPSDLPSDPKAK